MATQPIDLVYILWDVEDGEVCCSIIEDYCNPLDKSKRDPLDVRYPHRCFNSNCRMPLTFRELLNRNALISSPDRKSILCSDGIYRYDVIFYAYEKYKHLKKLWKCKYVKFLCCQCYDSRNELKLKQNLEL